MTTSLNHLYLNDITNNVGLLFALAVKLDISITDFAYIFASSSVAKEIEHYNPKYMCGLSSVELLSEILNIPVEDIKDITIFDRDISYWVGYVLSHFQIYKDIPYKEIVTRLDIDKLISLYPTLHEVDITKVISILEDNFIKLPQTKLKTIRLAKGFSQSQLAKRANVSIRNIQMYEQRKHNINKAQFDIVLRLSKALCCSVLDLYEY